MNLTSEMNELIKFLSKRDDYVIFAGFGAFLHTGVECSKDIDIFVSSFESVKKITKLLKEKNWKQVKQETDNKHYSVAILEKNKTSLDIVYSVTSKDTLYPTKEKIRFQEHSLNVLSKESMLITKINQLTYIDRAKEKYKRDRQVINILRKEIDIKKLRKILPKLHKVFWTFGRL